MQTKTNTEDQDQEHRTWHQDQELKTTIEVETKANDSRH